MAGSGIKGLTLVIVSGLMKNFNLSSFAGLPSATVSHASGMDAFDFTLNNYTALAGAHLRGAGPLITDDERQSN